VTGLPQPVGERAHSLGQALKRGGTALPRPSRSSQMIDP
jgi:hypothetical protein